jgi:SRSO17 transposase
LEEFAAEVFAPLARRDQRDKGAIYVRGLRLDGRRKSMQPMAERLGVDHQGLQQFVSSSTWAVEPIRERLARRAVEGLPRMPGWSTTRASRRTALPHRGWPGSTPAR